MALSGNKRGRSHSWWRAKLRYRLSVAATNGARCESGSAMYRKMALAHGEIDVEPFIGSFPQVEMH
jgi:hypothetical protein